LIASRYWSSAQAEQLIREGAVNRLELLEDAGLTTAEAKRVRYAMLPGTLKQTFKDES